jgi:PLP dependent protein
MPVTADPELVATIAERLTVVRDAISATGRNLDDVTIVAVTKGFDASVVAAAIGAGLTRFGENYADELVEKASAINNPRVRWTFQGRMQSNKISRLIPYVSLWQTISSAQQADALAKRIPGAAMCVQVNLTGRDVQGGCTFDDLESIVTHARDIGLDVRGLMGIGPDTDDSAHRRERFAALSDARERLALPIGSMGMSDDYLDAVAAGSTMVRLGSVLFGRRPPRVG